jgi:hypothetical protein
MLRAFGSSSINRVRREAKGNPAEVALAFKDTYRMLN